MFFQSAAHPHQRSAGAEASHEHVDLGQGVYNFRPGGLVVGPRVSAVAILVHHDVIVGTFFDQVLGDFDGAVGPPGAVRRDNLGTVGFQELDPLHAYVFWHYHRDLVALEPPDHRQSDSGIAAGGFEDRPIAAEFSVGFRFLDHVEGDAVFYAAGGVCTLQLGIDSHALLGAHTLEFHGRRVADGFQNSFVS